MSPKTATLAFALLSTSALVAAAVDLGADHAARAKIAHALAAYPDVSVARIDASLWRNRITLSGLKYGSASTHVSIGTLTLPFERPSLAFISRAEASPFDDDATSPKASPDAPAGGGPATEPASPDAAPAGGGPATPEAPAAAPPPAAEAAPVPPAGTGSASAENVVITKGAITYTIKRIDLAGTPLSNADLATLLDPKSDASIADRLKKVTAASIVIPEVKGDIVKPGDETHWVEHQILLANVVAGKVGAGSAGGTTLAVKDGDDVSNATFGAVEASGIDLTGLIHVFTDKRTDESEPLVPLMDSVSVAGATIDNVTKGTKVTIGPIKEVGFKGRPLKYDPSGVGGSDKAQTKLIVDDLVHSFALASFETGDFTFDGGASKDKVALDSFTIHGFGGGRLDDVAMKGFRYDGANAKVVIGGFDITSFNVPGQAATDPTPSPIPVFSKSEVTDIAVDVLTPASPTDVNPKRVAFTLKKIGLSGEATEDGQPRSGSLAFDKLEIDLPSGPDSPAAPLIDMGYSHLDISGGMKSTIDLKAQTLHVSDFVIDSAGMGTLGLGLDFANVSPGLFSSDPDASKVAALALLVKRLDIKLTNAGLVEKVLAWRAKADGLTPAQERDQAVDLVAVKLPASLGNGPKVTAIGAAIGKFLADPKSLHIGLSSPVGLGGADLALLGTPNVLIESLDVQASANGQ